MEMHYKRPKEGQFVAYWEFNGVPWSNTYKIIDGEIYKYSEDMGDTFHLDSGAGDFFEESDIDFIFLTID